MTQPSIFTGAVFLQSPLPPPWSASPSAPRGPRPWRLHSPPALRTRAFISSSCPQPAPPPARSTPSALCARLAAHHALLRALSRRRLISWNAWGLRGLGFQERSSSGFRGRQRGLPACVIARLEQREGLGWRRAPRDDQGHRWLRQDRVLGGSAGGSQRRWQEGEKSWSCPHGGHGTDARPASLGPPDHGVTSAWATVVPGLVPHPLPSVSTSFLEGLAASSEA